HRTDRLTAAIPPGTEGSAAFTQRYQALLRHYGLTGQAIQAGHANENGDVEQSHHRFKRALDQALMLRDSRDFVSRAAYEAFVRRLWTQGNAGRRTRLQEELPLLRPLPPRRLESCKRVPVRVDRGSTIHVQGNTYSVASRLIGERVEARLYMERVEVWYGQRRVESLPRLRGRGKHRVEYRQVIDWLVRKPGAFADYRYRQEWLPPSVSAVEEELNRSDKAMSPRQVTVAVVDLASYDALLTGKEADDDDGERRRTSTADGVLKGVAPAGLPVGLRGVGASGTAGDIELRAVPIGTGGAGVPGAAAAANGASAARLAAAVGEELGIVGTETSAGQGSAADAVAAGGVVRGAPGERAGIRGSGIG